MGLLELLQRSARYLGRERQNLTCDICGREVFGGERFCGQCRDALPWIGRDRCPVCGRAQKEAGLCLECKQIRPQYSAARSLFRHEGEAARLVLRLKNGERYLAQTLCEFLTPLLAEFPDADAVTFVPMTEKAERARGYNQSYLLAGAISKQSGLELLDVVKKVRETDAQKSLGRRERQKNLKGCFKVEEKKCVAGKTIVLIDDTLTTGATAGEVSERLNAAHAKKVYLVTVTSVGERAPDERAKR